MNRLWLAVLRTALCLACACLACGTAAASPETDRLAGLAREGDAAALDTLVELARRKK
ncbi:MAG: hypothetical protein JSS40_06665, partial [Proteobacteria bacterium]|nr:hypothetical protein [Pseudomonadota bacterium]